MSTIRIFISYSHDDDRWFDARSRYNFIPWLQESLRRDQVELWYDRGLEAGEEFQRRIEEEIDRADVAILLVSQAFVNSPFIETVELPRIEAWAARGELIVIPILVGPCDWDEVTFVSARQKLPGEPTPLLDYTESDRTFEQVRVDILRAIRSRLRSLRGGEAAPARASAEAPAPVPTPSPPAPTLLAEPDRAEPAAAAAPGNATPPVRAPEVSTPPVPVRPPSLVIPTGLEALVPGVSHLGNRGPVWEPGATPQTLGWGPDEMAYPEGIAVNPMDGAEVVWVPSGTFMMGSGDRHHPVHQVTLDGFWLYKCEVTNGQFAKFAQSSGHAIEGNWKKYTARGENHPVVEVTWNDAKAYGDWAGVALPTEAQWEYGARGPEGRKYPWGNDWDPKKCCNYKNLGQGNPWTFPVGSFPAGASWCGALDLAGNVWEWCADWYGPYEAGAARNPQGSSTGSRRVLRGGSWYFLNPGDCRSAQRHRNGPLVRRNYHGFRGVVSSK